MKHFTIEELTKSETAIIHGIDNTPTPEVKKRLTDLVNEVLDPARELFGKPIMITNGYRCPALNREVGGVFTSQHLKGEAADIQVVEIYRLYDIIKTLDFDQAILESKDILKRGKKVGESIWVHVSYHKEHNHKQAFRMHNGKII